MTTESNESFAQKISNLLQAEWDSDAAGLEASDVFWSHDKYETAASIEDVTKKAIISTYNPQNPVSVQVLSGQTSLVQEIVVVDVILHTSAFGSTDQTLAVREAVRKLILQIIHQDATVLPGADLMACEGEYVRGELPHLQREAFKVVVSSFEVLPK